MACRQAASARTPSQYRTDGGNSWGGEKAIHNKNAGAAVTSGGQDAPLQEVAVQSIKVRFKRDSYHSTLRLLFRRAEFEESSSRVAKPATV